MSFTIIFNQIGILGVLVLIGVIASKAKVLSPGINYSISKVTFQIAMPLLIFTTLASKSFTSDIIKNCSLVIAFSYAAMGSLFIIGKFSSRALKLNSDQTGVHVMHTMFGNIVFLGFPLLNALFPKDGLLYATIYQLASDSLMWSVGIFIINKKNRAPFKENIRHLLNANTIAFVFGLVIMSSGIKIPNLLLVPLKQCGSMTIPLSMIYIGGMLATIKVHGVLKHPHVFVLSFNKLVVAPIVILFLILVVNALVHLNMSVDAISIVVLETAMPAMAAVVVLAQRFGSDDKHATENVFVSTILSILTLPFILFCINYALKLPIFLH